MSIALNGTNQWVNLGLDLPVLRAVNGGTLMAWVRVTPGTLLGSQMLTYATGGAGTSDLSRLAIEVNPVLTPTVRILARSQDADGSRITAGATSLPTGLWTHVAGVVDYVTSMEYVYFNGVLDGQAAVAAFTAPTSNTNSRNGAIGAQDTGSGGFFPGEIEDARCYGRALNEAEIATIYAARGVDGIVAGLQARYLLNERADGLVAVACADISDNQRNGSPTNSPVYVAGILRDRRKLVKVR